MGDKNISGLNEFIKKLELELGLATLEAEEAKARKQSLEKELLEEIPQWKQARDLLTEANRLKSDLEARYRSAIELIVQNGGLPATDNVSVATSHEYTLLNEGDVVSQMIEELGVRASTYLQLKPDCQFPEIIEGWGARFQTRVNVRTEVHWSKLKKMVKEEK